MIAEIHGKVSRKNTNLTEQLEDELTGNFFGNLRYLPFNKYFRHACTQSIYPPNLSYLLNLIDAYEWSSKIEFWPNHKEAEIDVLITGEEILIGIEVKYKSGLSSDDDVIVDDQIESKVLLKSRNQLARESRLLTRIGKGKKKVLLLLADESSCFDIYSDVKRRHLVDEEVNFGYISWQKILSGLEKISNVSSFEKVILDDILDLLKRKGLEGFQGFDFEYNKVSSQIWEFFDQAINFVNNQTIKEDLFYDYK